MGGIRLVDVEAEDGSATRGDWITIQRPDACTVMVRSSTRLMGFRADTDGFGRTLWGQIQAAAGSPARGTLMLDMAVSFFCRHDHITEWHGVLDVVVPSPCVVWGDAVLERLQQTMGGF